MVKLNDRNFKEEVEKADKPILVDFWAEWCMPCALIAPILEKVAADYEDRLILAKVNLDEAPMVAGQFQIDAIPCMMLFKKGEPVSKFVGLKPEALIKEWLDKFL